jgi:hypothetical protein
MELAEGKRYDGSAVIAKARAALAQPESVAPTDEELDDLFTEIDQSGEALSWRAFARAVLAKWGTPQPPAAGEVAAALIELRSTVMGLGQMGMYVAAQRVERAADLLRRHHPQPVPVSERLPLHITGELDDQGTCWNYHPINLHYCLCVPDPSVHTHWLPANALPTPEATNV